MAARLLGLVRVVLGYPKAHYGAATPARSALTADAVLGALAVGGIWLPDRGVLGG